MNAKYLCAVLILILGALESNQSRAQITFSEDFTGATTTNSWYFFNGACLTAGTSSSTSSPGTVPACTTVLSSYYGTSANGHSTDSDAAMVGGNNGFLGSSTAPSSRSTQVPDPIIKNVGFGALRFTNGSPYGHNENGAILSSNTFGTGAGLQVTFKTITYNGDGGGPGKDGADGISFFLMDGSKPPGLGAFGGSLAYSCSNNNTPYDGLNGAYLGLGIDEFGNFLNGSSLVSGYTGSNVASGDNTALGYGYKPGRIGLRGAGSISWAALTAAYPSNPSSSTLPYYPASLATSCAIAGGTYSAATNNCVNICSAGSTYDAATAVCQPNGLSETGTKFCPAGQTIDSTGQFCYPNGDSNSGTNYCPAGQTISGTTCYPTGDSISGTKYCPAGQTINSAGTSCYPTGDPINSAGTKYCPAGQTFDSTGAFCYPTGDSNSGTNYCPAGLTISGTSCGTANAVFGSGEYCPAGDNAPSSGKCCPSGYNLSGGTCKKTGSANVAPTTAPSAASTAMLAATAMPNATAMATATAMPAATNNPSATTGKVDALFAVQNTCRTGNLYNYSSPAAPTSAGPATLANTANTKGILDYAPIPNAFKEVTSFQIANESATTRGAATAIFYNLTITQDGLLSLSYAVSGGAFSSLISNQSITASNGTLPASFRVGFAGSTGGDTNIHEILCFKAASANQSGSSATVNEKEAAKVEAGTQAYFAFYNPNDWTGTLTANNLIDNGGVVTVSTTPNWDSSCVLSWSSGPAVGGGCASTTNGGTPAAANRIMLTWDTVNNVGIPFEWTNLNSFQQAALVAGDSSPTSNRLNYLRGDRTNEINTLGAGLYRKRDSLLGDVVDSSPSWVGPPSSPYTSVWQDRLSLATPMPENSGTQSYLQFVAAEQTRLNVVYVGSNDGFLHGFRAGSFDVNGNFVANSTTPNDGQEILAYMPGSTLVSSATQSATGGCTNDVTTGTVVQQIHGVTPLIGTNPECVEPVLDLSNTQYGHNFFVDATPGTGDLFFGGQWHTWLVGGLGVGGAAIYALDITNPSSGTSAFSEGNASQVVIGEWNAGSITCTNVTCGSNLGNTFGTPQIRRLHDGNWAVIFGNGFGSQSGDAGIFIMSVNSSTGAKTFRYLSTTASGSAIPGGNGIGYVTPADLDGDHITDYVYAGDLKGNVWRFDLTSSNPANWAAGSTPLFTTQSGQPITSQLLVISTIVPGSAQRLLIEFGTGQRTQITNLNAATYAGGTQSLYGVWDWNMAAWNALSPGALYASVASASTLTSANLQAQTLSPPSASGTVDGTNVAICWQGTTSCTGSNVQFGWYANLPSASEQVIFNPVFFQGAFLVNTIVPANNSPTSCSSNLDSGFTYALSVGNGGVFTNTFTTFTKNGTVVTDALAAGVATNATGSVYVVTTGEHTTNIVYQTIPGTPGSQEINIPSNTKSKRLTWIERR
ncbi:MAG TPA: PilC/PilY family type IV pilus protein [Steroidobacteraceae bacterium]|jgi:type IV pilus assembly protein PilY1|nr:PilC/PilY family type IV pilus protein [Steroidobacteraceae bacterium]